MNTLSPPPFQNSSTHHGCGVRGFTLLEMLTAVAIVGVLVAILLPVLGSMSQRAKNAECVSRLRALGQAFHLYAADNNGALPSFLARVGEGWQVPYFNQLAPYLELETHSPYTNPNGSLSAVKKKWNSRFYCPAGPQGPPAIPAWALSTYGMSTTFSGATTSEPPVNYIRTLATVDEPGKKAMFACVKEGYVVHSVRAFIGPGGWLADWHNGGCNVIFVDGHVAHVNDLTSVDDPRNMWWRP